MFAQKKEEEPNADAIERAAAKALVQPHTEKSEVREQGCSPT